MNIPSNLIADSMQQSERHRELTRIARAFIGKNEPGITPEVLADNQSAQLAFIDCMNILLSFRSLASGKTLADAPSLLSAFTALIFGLQLNPFWQRAQGLLNPAFVAAAQGILDSYSVTQEDVARAPEMVWQLSHGHLELGSLFLFAAHDHVAMLNRSFELKKQLERL